MPAIKPAAAASRSGLISVLATRGTVARDYTHALVRDHAADCEVTLVGSSLLAVIAERVMRGEAVDDPEIAREIAPCFVERDGRRTDHVVLACTHFPLIVDRLERLSPWPVGFVDPAPAIARRLDALIGAARAGAPPAHGGAAIFTSGEAPPAGAAKDLASLRVDVYPLADHRLGSGLIAEQIQHSERPPMRTSVGQPVRLTDYRAPDYLIDLVELDVSLDIHATRVVSTLSIRPNPAGREGRRACARRR